MKKQSILMLLVLMGMAGCGGKATQSDESAGGTGGADAGLGGSGGSGGTAAGGTAGTGGTAGVAGTGGVAGAGAQAGTAGAGGTSCGFTTTEPACDACMNDQCVSECETCAGSTECASFVLCALACTTGDSECMQTCVETNAGGVEDGLPLIGPDGCLRENCNAECIAVAASCDVSLGDPACDACVVGYCMAECQTCANNESCVDLVACGAACDPDDQGCLMECAAQNVSGIGDANAFVGDGGCVSQHCSVECNEAPAQCGIDMGDPACDACVSDKCLLACNECAGSDDCTELVACALGCGDDQGCLTQCAIEHPLGIAAGNAFNSCVEQKCPAECGGGSTTCEVESGNAACDACIASECAGSCASCSENPDCLELVACVFACDSDDLQCQFECGSAHPGGLTDAGGLIGPGACVESDCSFWCD